MVINERIQQIVDEMFQGNKAKFANAIGMPPTSVSNYIGKQRASKPSVDMLEKIVKSLNVNPKWLITGEGEFSIETDSKTGGIPLYQRLPVSAGKKDLMTVECDEKAVGFIDIAGVVGKYAFPVIGCSMEPVIHAGDIVVVDDVNRWDKIDPDKIYLIITHDDRMIKHIEIDEQNHDILWCVSPNYKRFSIHKEEVIKIYRVTFYGRLA